MLCFKRWRRGENIIKLLIENKTKINIEDNRGDNVLYLSLRSGTPRLNILKLLINDKIDINKEISEKLTPLIRILKNDGEPEMVKLFINNKTDFNQKDIKRQSIFMIFMIYNRFYGIIDLINKYKIDYLEKDQDNNTLLTLLVRKMDKNLKNKDNWEELFYFLLKKNIDVNQINTSGITALYWALFNNLKLDIVDALINKKTILNQKLNSNSLLKLLLHYDDRDKIIYKFLDKNKIDYRLNIMDDNIDKEEIGYLISKKKNVNNRDEYGWNLFNYFDWKHKMGKVSYLMIFYR